MYRKKSIHQAHGFFEREPSRKARIVFWWILKKETSLTRSRMSHPTPPHPTPPWVPKLHFAPEAPLAAKGAALAGLARLHRCRDRPAPARRAAEKVKERRVGGRGGGAGR